MGKVDRESLANSVKAAIMLAEYDRGGDWSAEYRALEVLRGRSEKLNAIVEAVELHLATMDAYQPLPAYLRELGGRLELSGTPTLSQLRLRARARLRAELATCKAATE